MNKKVLWGLLTFIMVTMLSVSFAACSSDDDDFSDDPDGTVTAIMQASDGGIDFFNYHAQLYIADGKFGSLNGFLYIYDCGIVKGLADITSIPASDWVLVRSNPEAKVGHGYVVRYTNSNFGVILHARMYITKKSGDGYEIKYQSPFDTHSTSSLKDLQIVSLKATSLTRPFQYGEGKVIYEDSKYRYKIAAINTHSFCLYPYYKDGSDWKLACSSVYDEVMVDGLWLCGLSTAINDTSLEKITQKMTDYTSKPAVMQSKLSGSTGFYGYITTEDGTRKQIRFCSTNILYNHDQTSSEIGYIVSVDMYYQEY